MEYPNPNQRFINFLDTMIVLYCLVIIYLCNDTFASAVNDTFKAIDMAIYRLGVIF